MRLSGVGRGAVMETMSGEACEAVVKSVACRAAEVEPSIGSGSAGVVWLSEGTVRPGALGLSERVSSACAVTALVGVMVAKVDDRLIILVVILPARSVAVTRTMSSGNAGPGKRNMPG